MCDRGECVHTEQGHAESRRSSCWTFHSVPRYFANKETDGRPCLCSLSVTIRSLRRAGMTEQVPENMPAGRLSRKALFPCFHRWEFYRPQICHTRRNATRCCFKGGGVPIIDVPRKAETPPSGSRWSSEKALIQAELVQCTHACGIFFFTRLLCNLSRRQLHSVVSNERGSIPGECPND